MTAASSRSSAFVLAASLALAACGTAGADATSQPGSLADVAPFCTSAAVAPSAVSDDDYVRHPTRDTELISCLGPAVVSTDDVGFVEAQLDNGGSWRVEVNMRDINDEVRDGLDDLAGDCFQQLPSCPSGAFSVVVDGEVVFTTSVMSPVADAELLLLEGDDVGPELADLMQATLDADGRTLQIRPLITVSAAP